MPTTTQPSHPDESNEPDRSGEPDRPGKPSQPDGANNLNEPEGPVGPLTDGADEVEVSFTVAGPNGTFVDGPIHTVAGRELWVLSIPFFAHDPVHAMTMARHATRRVAKVFPRFEKNGVLITRENTYGGAEPLYCDMDIYCVQPPHHTGPCRSQDGRNLDDYNDETDPTPEFGSEI